MKKEVIGGCIPYSILNYKGEFDRCTSDSDNYFDSITNLNISIESGKELLLDFENNTQHIDVKIHSSVLRFLGKQKTDLILQSLEDNIITAISTEVNKLKTELTSYKITKQ